MRVLLIAILLFFSFKGEAQDENIQFLPGWRGKTLVNSEGKVYAITTNETTDSFRTYITHIGELKEDTIHLLFTFKLDSLENNPWRSTILGESQGLVVLENGHIVLGLELYGDGGLGVLYYTEYDPKSNTVVKIIRHKQTKANGVHLRPFDLLST
jgi:hypothetical protein